MIKKRNKERRRGRKKERDRNRTNLDLHAFIGKPWFSVLQIVHPSVGTSLICALSDPCPSHTASVLGCWPETLQTRALHTQAGQGTCSHWLVFLTPARMSHVVQHIVHMICVVRARHRTSQMSTSLDTWGHMVMTHGGHKAWDTLCTRGQLVVLVLLPFPLNLRIFAFS